jgi:hypothetical protein
VHARAHYSHCAQGAKKRKGGNDLLCNRARFSQFVAGERRARVRMQKFGEIAA